jgi:hypothetical protein
MMEMIEGLLRQSATDEAQQWLATARAQSAGSPYFAIIDPNAKTEDSSELLGMLQLVDAIFYTQRTPPVSIIHAKLGAEGAAQFSQNATTDTPLVVFQTLILQGQIIYDFLYSGAVNDLPYSNPRTAVIDAERLCDTLGREEIYLTVAGQQLYYGKGKHEAEAKLGAFDNTLYIPPITGAYGIVAYV